MNVSDHVAADHRGNPLAIKLRAVENKTGLHKTGVYARLDPSSHLRDESFPQPFSYQTGRGVFWVAAEIDAWVNDQVQRYRSGEQKPRHRRAALGGEGH